MKKLKSQFVSTARIKYLKISPFKMRRVADVIRGKNADESFFLLSSLSHKGARLMLDILKSAVANAKDTSDVDSSDLMIKSIWVDSGFVMKRHQPRARGRMFAIKKRTSHVFLGLEKNKGVV